MKEITITKENMILFANDINKENTNGEIFLFLRDLQDEAKKDKAKITNIGNLYWFLIDHRDKLQAA